MSFSIPQKLFAEMLGILVRVPEGRNTIPVAECVKICFNDDGISLAATNFNHWVTLSTLGFKPKKDNVVALIPVKQLHALIAAIDKDQKITLSVTEKRMTVKAGGSNYKFGSLPPEDWPSVEWADKSETVTLSAKQFCKAFSFVAPSISIEDTRYYLNGACLRMLGDKKLRFMATDGHQGASAIIELQKKTKLPETILPKEIVALYLDLLRRLSDETEVSFELTENRARMEFEGEYSASLITKLIDGDFPDMDRVMPYDRAGAVEYIVPREVTLNAIHRMRCIAANDKGSGICLSFEDGKLKLSAKNDASSEAEETIKLDGKHKDGQIGVSAYILISLLSTFPESNAISIIFDPKEPGAPILIADPKTELKPEAEAISVCMPMRI